MADGTTTESTRSRAASTEPSTDQADRADGAPQSGQTRVEGQPPVATTTTGSNGKSVPANPPELGRATVSEPSTPSTVGKAAPRSGPSRSGKNGKDGKDGKDGDGRPAKSGKVVKKGSDLIRSRIASLVWLVCLLAAIVLAGGALLLTLDANMQNDLVKAVIDLAHKLDGPFWRVFEFHSDTKGPGPGPHDATKEHLVNWGLAAAAWLVVGRVLDRVIRP